MQRSAARSSAPSTGNAPAWQVWSALWAVYIVWGSTYLAIRVAVRTMPPFLMAGVRFVFAGALLYAWSLWRGHTVYERPTWKQWRAAAIVGGALLLGGNGAVVWAEQRIDSGIAALVVATVPLWMALMDRVFFGQRLAWTAILGLGLGFGGLAVLATGGHGDAHITAAGVGAVMFASFSWAAGSLYSRRAPLPSRPLVGTGMEMIAGGVLLGIAGLVLGEGGKMHLSEFSAGSWFSLAYLIVFGSLVGFTAYVWLLRNARTTLVSTYAYVNPVIAVLGGWLILNEAITTRTLVGGAIIVMAVVLIVTARQMPVAAEPAAAEPPEPVVSELGDEGRDEGAA
jgi:drug/metabolite transporter (DMT)-like permease